MMADRHQQVLDEAWAWLRDRCGWFSRDAIGSGKGDERVAQLWRWNERPGSPFVREV